MSVNLKMDGTTYEGANKITVGGKTIDILEIAGDSGASMELVGTLTNMNTNGSSNFWSGTTYGVTVADIPNEFKPKYSNGIKIIDFEGTNQGSASANGIQKAVYIYGNGKTMSLQTGYRSGNSRQSASSEVGDFTTYVTEVYSGNTYTLVIPTTCKSVKIYEVEIPSAIASAILAVNS